MTQDQYKCRECGQSFDSQLELEQHNRNVHSHYTCEECGQTFGSENELKEHMRRMHPEIEKVPTR